MLSLEAFQERIGVQFTEAALLEQALTHPSYRNENKNKVEDNQRLEFLGDAVLGFISGELLYRRFPNAPEGRLTRLRAALVRAETLAGLALQCAMDQALLLGRSEEESGGRSKTSSLGDVFEAVLGAVYLDQGLDAARAFVQPLLEEVLVQVIEQEFDKDPKTRLQEWAQKHLALLPTYEVIDSQGPEHAKEFTVAIYIDGQQKALGKGPSKRAAGEQAAQFLLDHLEELLPATQ